MAITTVTKRLALTTTLTTVYTVQADERVTVSLLQIAPVDASNAVNVSAQWTDASDSDAATYLCFEEAIEIGVTGPIYPLGGVLYLDAGDTIKARASADGDAELTFSAMIESVA